MGGLVMMGELHPAQWKQLPYTISNRFRILGGGLGKVQGSISEHFALFDKNVRAVRPQKSALRGWAAGTHGHSRSSGNTRVQCHAASSSLT
jgi:hypothetical protein